MAFFTKEQFSRVANTRAGTKSFSQLINESRNESSSGKTTTVFLSHCHADQDQVGKAIAFFKGFGINIYIDWQDESMPQVTSGVTAQKIKSKIISNDKFILLATNNAIASKWCNWELGIGDTFKFAKDKMLLLPLEDSPGNWAGNEYLQLYPRAEPVDGHENIFRVVYPDKSTKWLDDWLKL